MSALVEYVCDAAHLDEKQGDGPLTTMVGREWAYCAWGGFTGHDWKRIEPTSISTLRIGPGVIAGPELRSHMR